MKLRFFVKSHVKQSVSTALCCRLYILQEYRFLPSPKKIKLPRAVRNLVYKSPFHLILIHDNFYSYLVITTSTVNYCIIIVLNSII